MMKANDQAAPMTAGWPGAHRVRAQLGAHAALFLHLQRRRQGAGVQHDGQLVGALGGEIAGDLPRPPGMAPGSRGADTILLSSTMANRLPMFSAVTWREAARADAVEAEIHDRLAGLLIEALAGVGQHLAGTTERRLTT